MHGDIVAARNWQASSARLRWLIERTEAGSEKYEEPRFAK